jgi:hypothetical protein
MKTPLRIPVGTTRCQIFLGTYLAHAQVCFVELIQLFPVSPVPHNLKVIGSNPIPATKI